MTLTDAQRRQFDLILGEIIAQLPERYQALLDEIPVVVEDRASPGLLNEVGIDPRTGDLCGLHSGIALTRRSVEQSGHLPDTIMLFREPIMSLARVRPGGSRRFGAVREAGKRSALESLENQIRITLLHEMGHHFGLDEDDLTELGYG